MRKGRELEILIKKISELQIENATITSPEYVQDIDTGTKREVDVTIRRKINSKEVFVAIECRDRGSIQDIQWVEQLISKKESVGADSLIAVTSSDFTFPAQLKAQKRGVILKRISKSLPAEIEEIVNEIYIEFSFVRPLIHKVDILIPPFLNQDLSKYKYLHSAVEGELNFDEIISIWNTPALIRTVCSKVTDFKNDKFAKFEFSVDGSYVITTEGRFPIASARFIYEFNQSVLKLPLSSISILKCLEENSDEATIYEYMNNRRKLSEVIHDIEKDEFRWNIYSKTFLKEGMVLIGAKLKSDKPISITMMQLDI